MARMPKVEPIKANSLVASAARIGGRGLANLSRNSRADGWQNAAWGFYHSIGEFRYACDLIGAMLSKALIHATFDDGHGAAFVKDGPAFDFINQLYGDADGRAEMLRMIGIHMSVAGECYLVSYPDTDPMGDGGDVWEIVAATKLGRPAPGGKWIINSKTIEADVDDVLVIRIWRPDPVDPDTAVSPARAVLSILGEIQRLTDHVAAQVDSRLAGAGILLMPTEMTFPAPPAVEGENVRVANTAEDLMRVIQENMATAIVDRSDPSALVPIVITAPAEVIDKIQHLTFWTELDKQAIDLRNEAIRRLGLGMDIPPEVLTGSGDSNHWSAWQSDESAIKSHTEPLLKLITTALAKGFLRPLLVEAKGLEGELRQYSIGADTSALRLRPNRSKEALELYNLGALSQAALRRETGFDEDDVMDEKEYQRWLKQKVASGSTTPELVASALESLGVDLPVLRQIIQGEVVEDETQEARPDPSIADHPEQGIPDREVSERRKEARKRGDVPSSDIERKSSLIAAAEQIALRALERAGNKLKNKIGVKVNIAAFNLHTLVAPEEMDFGFLLADAWGHVPTIAERYSVDPAWLELVLSTYCSELMAAQKPHDYDHFTKYIALSHHLSTFQNGAPE